MEGNLRGAGELFGYLDYGEDLACTTANLSHLYPSLT